MPVKKSAKGALKVDIRRKAENDLTRAKVKNALKSARISIEKNEKDFDKKISIAQRELDIAAKKNVIHKNKAARLKSRLVKKIKNTQELKKPATK